MREDGAREVACRGDLEGARISPSTPQWSAVCTPASSVEAAGLSTGNLSKDKGPMVTPRLSANRPIRGPTSK